MGNAMTKFLIAGIQRTGTTLIRTTLNKHPDILSHGEVFFMGTGGRGKVSVRRGFQASIDEGYRYFVDRTLARRIRHYFARDSLVREYLDALYSTPGYSAIGFKIMFGQTKRYPAVLSYIRESKVHVIHVIRKNVFRTMLSALTKQARGLAHSTGVAENVTVRVPIENLVQRLKTIRRDGTRWKDVLDGHPAYLAVTYEAFVEDPAVQVDRILGFLDLEPGIDLQSDLVKMNTATLPEIVENFDEVWDTLAGTEFSWCLD